MVRAFVITLCVLFQIAVCLGQQILNADILDMDDGLSQRDVRFATRDARGFLWIVGSDIDMYDGQRFTRFNRFDDRDTLPISGIRFACRLRDSLLIFGESKQLYFLNMYTRESGSFPLPSGMSEDFFNVISIVDRQNHEDFIFVTKNDEKLDVHLVDRNWNAKYVYTIPKENSLRLSLLRSMAAGRSGELFLIDRDDQCIVRASAEGVDRIPFDLTYERMVATHRIAYRPEYGLIVVGRDGRISGIPDDADSAVYLFDAEIGDQTLNATHMDSEGRLWVVCPDRIVRFKMDKESEEVFYQSVFSDFVPPVHSSMEDDEGITWFASEIGLLRIQREPLPFRKYLVQDNGLRNLQFREVLPGLEPNSLIARMYHYDRTLVELQFDDKLNLDTNVIAPVVPSNGTFRRFADDLYYLRSDSDILERTDLTNLKKEYIALPERSTTQFYNKFFVSDDGCIHYQNYDNQLVVLQNDGRDSIFNLLSSDSARMSPWRVLNLFDNKWLIGTESNGVLIFDANNGSLLHHFHKGSSPAISGNFINCISIAQDSNLWVGTLGSGVNRIDLTQHTAEQFTTANGLPNNQVASILIDDLGRAWIGTYDGLAMYDENADEFQTFYTRDGISSNEFNYLAAHKGSDGRFYMGSFNGMTVFDPKDISRKVPLPPVVITSIETYDRRTKSTKKIIPAANDNVEVEVGPFDNYIEFQFTIPSFRDNTSHNFRTKVDEIDPTWQDHGQNSTIRYQKLPAGNYTMQVMGLDAKYNTTSRPTTIELTVKQPFYKSFWFFIVISLLTIGLIYLLYRYRLGVLQKQQEMRSRIASDLHDEIGGSLTAVSMQLQMLELKSENTMKNALRNVGSKVNDSASKMRDLVWSIDTSSDSWANIIEHMHDCGYDLLSPKEIAFNIVSNGIEAASSPTPHVKQNLFLIYKEALTNIARHSDATQVDIELSREDGFLLLRVLDNGRPPISSRVSKGHGLSNMRLRAQRLGGKLKTEWRGEDGFLVEVRFPV